MAAAAEQLAQGHADVPKEWGKNLVACIHCKLVKTEDQVLPLHHCLLGKHLMMSSMHLKPAAVHSAVCLQRLSCMQFYDSGCENCVSQSMMGDAERVQECTTNDFQGLVTILNPGSSWTARWLHIGEMYSSIHR